MAFLLFPALSWQSNVALAKADLFLIGEDSGDYLGNSIIGIGDVNGDDIPDFCISAPRNDQNGQIAGKIYIFFGKNTDWPNNIDINDANASFLGEFTGDEAGHALGGGGDVNGDGFDDLLISAPRNEETGEEDGQTYLIFGRSSGWTLNTNLSNANASFLGEVMSDRSGNSIAIIEDVNGDNFDDILIADKWNDEYEINAGKIYLIFGRSSGWEMDISLSNSNASYHGIHYLDHAGYSVAGVGDINGDTFGDFIIGAYLNDELGTNAGQSYLIFGKELGWNNDVNLSNADVSFNGEHEYDSSGTCVTGVGDVNKDGYDDFMISSPGNDESENSAGQIYLMLGKDTWNSEYNLSDVDASFCGENSNDNLGRAISGGFDINNDTYDDLLIGSTNYKSGSCMGKTYIIFGKESGWAMDVSISNADASFIGEKTSDTSGNSLAGLGDVNGDDFDDFLIGAYQYNDDDDSLVGKVYLFFGAEERNFNVSTTPFIPSYNHVVLTFASMIIVIALTIWIRKKVKLDF